MFQPLVSLYTDAGAPPFASDPVEVYGARFLTAILIFGIALLLFSLLRYRGRTPSLTAWSLLFLGVVILPSVSTNDAQQLRDWLVVVDRAFHNKRKVETIPTTAGSGPYHTTCPPLSELHRLNRYALHSK